MNDKPNSAIRTLRPIGNVTVGIIAAITIASCSSDHPDDVAAATTLESQAVTTSEPSSTATPTTLRTTTVTATDEPTEATISSPRTVAVVPGTTTPTPLDTAVTVAPTTATGFFTGPDHVAVAYTVPDGWEALGDGQAVIKSGSDPIFGASFWDIANIFVDPCQGAPFDPPVGPTVDELASAWEKVPAIEVTSTNDVTVDGYIGREVEFTVPNYDASECKWNMFGLWQEDGGPGSFPHYWAQGPNVHLQLWILDVDGTRLVIKASYFPNTAEHDRADLEEILDSIQIG